MTVAILSLRFLCLLFFVKVFFSKDSPLVNTLAEHSMVANAQICKQILAFGSNKLGIDTPLSIPANGCRPSWMSYRMKQTHAMGKKRPGRISHFELRAKASKVCA